MRMVELVTSFARSGKPSIAMGEGMPPFLWDSVSAANASHLNIGNMMVMDQVSGWLVKQKQHKLSNVKTER